MGHITELEEYRQYTGPKELHKAINMLSGIVQGIKADETIKNSEIQELSHWCVLHANLANRHPFNELIPVVEAALYDKVLSTEEKEDIIWLCSRYAYDKDYYDEITSTLQVLCGIVHGMLADKELNDREIYALSNWVSANDFLKGCYPFDEIESLLTSILSDHVITNDEREALMAFLGNLVEFKDSYNLTEPDFVALREKHCVAGICAVCPNIVISGSTFCFTGASYKCTRDDLAAAITERGGIFRNNVSSKTTYLIVGNAGNPCWSYACYGRKIEKAMQLRKEGKHVQIVNEVDLWDALEDV